MADLIFYDSIRRYATGEEDVYCKHEKTLSNDVAIKLNAVLSLETDDHVIHSAYKSSYLKELTPFNNGFFEDVKFQAHAILEAKSMLHITNPLYIKHCHNKQITAYMDCDKVIKYLESRISLHNEILLRYSGFGEDIEKWSNFGIRGAISLALNKMQKFYNNEKVFNSKTKIIFEFLNVRIANLEKMISYDLKTNLDYQAKNYYDRFHA
jgi:hypothetical protein